MLVIHTKKNQSPFIPGLHFVFIPLFPLQVATEETMLLLINNVYYCSVEKQHFLSLEKIWKGCGGEVVMYPILPQAKRFY